MGPLQVERVIAERLVSGVPCLVFDAPAHAGEHSLEVQLPFLVHLFGHSPPIVPIVMTDQSLETATALGEGLGSLLEGRSFAVVASSDLSHYLTYRQATREDAPVLAAIKILDAAELAKVVKVRNHNTICAVLEQ